MNASVRPQPLLAQEEIKRYRPLIKSRARSFWRGFMATRVTLEDLEEIAAIAVWNAVRTWDPVRQGGAKFGTYVIHVVNNALNRERFYWQKTKRVGWGVSLSPGDDGELAVVLFSDDAQPEEQLETIEWRQQVRDAVDKLKPRLKEVIEHRFWRDESQVEIGERLGVSRQRVQQIEVEACDELRPKLRHLWTGDAA